MNGKARVVVVLAAVLVACGVVHGMGLNKDPRKKAPPRNEDVPLILCDACHHLSERLYSLGGEKMVRVVLCCDRSGVGLRPGAGETSLVQPSMDDGCNCRMKIN